MVSVPKNKGGSKFCRRRERIGRSSPLNEYFQSTSHLYADDPPVKQVNEDTMADPAFTETEAEAGPLASPGIHARTRQDKGRHEAFIEPSQHETAPLLGPPILADQTVKRWYNTPSVHSPTRRGRLMTRCFGYYRPSY